MAPSQRKVLWPPNLSPRPYDGYDPRDGQSVLFVPLGRSGVTAHIDKEDYERLIAAGVPLRLMVFHSSIPSLVFSCRC